MMYFRFYDPRVLRIYLPTCTLEESRVFFGPIDGFLVESADGEKLIGYTIGPDGIVMEPRPFSPEEALPPPVILKPSPEQGPVFAEDNRMILRPEQIQAFTHYMTANFEDRLILHLREAYPEEVWEIPPDELSETVRRAMDRAMAHGLVTEGDVAGFVDLTFELGPDFESDENYDWAANILHDPNLDGTRKIKRINHFLHGSDYIEEDYSEVGLLDLDE